MEHPDSSALLREYIGICTNNTCPKIKKNEYDIYNIYVVIILVTLIETWKKQGHINSKKNVR